MGTSNAISENSNGNIIISSNINSSSSTETATENQTPPAAPYAQGEKVLANHTSCLYEAKVRFLSLFPQSL